MAIGALGSMLDAGRAVLTRVAADNREESTVTLMIDAARRDFIERNNAAISEVPTSRRNAFLASDDVTSASSLLIVIPDPAAARRQLGGLAKPGGNILIIEASREATRMRAFWKVLYGDLGRRA